MHLNCFLVTFKTKRRLQSFPLLNLSVSDFIFFTTSTMTSYEKRPKFNSPQLFSMSQTEHKLYLLLLYLCLFSWSGLKYARIIRFCGKRKWLRLTFADSNFPPNLSYCSNMDRRLWWPKPWLSPHSNNSFPATEKKNSRTNSEKNIKKL